MQNNNIPNNLTKTLKSNFELPGEIAELAIDQVIDSQILKDIPVVGWLAKASSLSNSISDVILYNKILRFLSNLDSINSSEKEKFRNKISDDKQFSRRVGEQLLLCIEKSDNLDKIDLLALCFDHFLTSDIDYAKFCELSHAINISLLGDLLELKNKDRHKISYSCLKRLTNGGLSEYGLSSYEGEQDVGVTLSDNGKRLLEIFKGTYREGYKKKEEERKAQFKELRNRNLFPTSEGNQRVKP